MNKRPNPFQPSFQPSAPTHYPPLPQGPPPPVNQQQQDWSAYWAAQATAAAGSGASGQPPPPAGYPAPVPPPPPGQWQPPSNSAGPSNPASGEHAALYRNYGYGGQQAAAAAQQHAQAAAAYGQWQQSQQQPHVQYPHGYPPQQPVQAFHVPYQYPQPGVPHPMHYGPQPPSYGYPQAHVPVPQPQPPPPPQPHAQPPPQPPNHPHHHNHTSPHHFPPAKRPRFDSNANMGNRPSGPSNHMPTQPPPLHFKPGGGMVPSGPSNSNQGPPPNAPKFPLPTGPAARNTGIGGGGQLSGPGRGGAMQRGGGRGGLAQNNGRGGRLGGGMGGNAQVGAPMGMSSGSRAGPMSGGRGGGSFGSGRSTPRGPAAFRANRQDGGNQGGGSKLGGSGTSRKDSFHPPTGPSSTSRSGRGSRDNQRDRSRDRQPSKDLEKETPPSSGGLPSSAFNFTPSGAFGGINSNGIRGGSPFPTGYTGKRTLTDFRIIGFGLGNMSSTNSAMTDDEMDNEEDDELDWTWGITPTVRRRSSSASTVRSLESSQRESHQEHPSASAPQDPSSSEVLSEEPSGDTTETNDEKDDNDAQSTLPSGEPRPAGPRTQASFKLSSTNSIPLVPRDKSDSGLGRKEKSETSRIRIYFHSPIELEDTQHQKRGRVWEVIPKPELSDKIPGLSTAVGGKRKKDPEEEGDDDVERQREHGKRIKEEPGQDISLQSSAVDPEIPGMLYPSDTDPSELEVEGIINKTVSAATTSTQGLEDGAEHATEANTRRHEGPSGNYPASEVPENDMQYLHPDDEDAALELYTEFENTSDADGQIDIDENDAQQETETAESSPHNAEWKDSSWSVDDQIPVSQSLPKGWKPQQAGLLSTSPTPRLKKEDATPTSLTSAIVVSTETPDVLSSASSFVSNTTSVPDEGTSSTKIEEFTNDSGPTSTPFEIKAEDITLIGEQTEDQDIKPHPQEEQSAPSSSKLPMTHAPGTTPSACPSPNRISISYASSTRRLVMDAHVIERVKVWRVKGKIELLLLLELADDDGASLGRKVGGRSVSGTEDGEEGARAEMSEQSDSKPDVESSSGVTPTFHALKVDQDVVTESTELPISNGSTTETDAAKLDERASGVAPRRYRGILIDAYDEASQAYIAVPHSTFSQDPTLPPFARYVDPSGDDVNSKKVRLVVYLDKERPLSEPKWVKTGDIDEWLKNMFGQGKTEERATWNGKIDIVDPDPPPTIFTIIDNWAQNSASGPPKERRRFIKDHLTTNFDHILEILLRLVRGERAANNQTNSPYGHGSQMGQQSQVLSSPLAAALTPNASHAAQQTHVSLAVLSLFRMAMEYGEASGLQSTVVEGRVSDIIRSLPQHLVYKSLDGIFREWLAAQKRSSSFTGSRG